jgi:hypothetical protein
MTIQINTRTFVGISNLLLQRQSDGVIFSWPQPETFVLNTGITEVIQNGRDALGRKVRSNTYVSEEMPELTIQYQYMHPELISFQVGKQMVLGTFDTFIPRSLVVRQAEYPAAATGFLFNGVLATEAEAVGALVGAAASYTDDNGISVALTRQPFATFNAATDDSFAVGDDGALKFSTNLVTDSVLVTMLIPASVAGARISETLVGPMRLYAIMVDTNGDTSIFEAPNVSANLSGRSVDVGGGSMELALYINYLPGSCSAWSILSVADAKAICG